MLRKRGFTLIELLVVISIIALLIGILLPALGAARRTANQMKNSTQVRGIIQGCILYSQGNSDYYPGISVATGTPTVATAANPAVSGQGAGTVIDRIQALINGNYFTPEYALNPVASGEQTTSYALLRISQSSGTAPTNRSSEWKNTTNSTAIVISDKSIANGSGYRSWWTSPSNNTTDWRGSVCWNDNHVTFETSLTVANTKFTGGNTITSDDIFAGADTDYDAFNVYTNATTR